MRLNRPSFFANKSYRILQFVKRALFSLVWDTKMSSVLGIGRVHEFYGLKVSQISRSEIHQGTGASFKILTYR